MALRVFIIAVCLEVLEGVALKLDAKEKKSQVSIEEAIAGYCKCSAPGQCQNAELTLKQNKMVSVRWFLSLYFFGLCRSNRWCFVWKRLFGCFYDGSRFACLLLSHSATTWTRLKSL
jgi:hypothetical protein